MAKQGLRCFGVVVMAVLLGAAPVAKADRSEARRVYDEATAAFGLGHYAEAAEKYEKAFSIHPDPALLYNCAQAYRLAGNHARALELYRNYLRLYPDRSNAEEARSQVAALSKAIDEEKQGAVAPPPVAPIAATPPPVAPMPSSSATVPAPASPSTSAPVSQTVAAGIAAGPSAEASPASGSRTWIWIVVGAVVVVGATTAILLATRADKFPDASYGTATGN
jgi:tetratricopeptide (TPR) repeat protein